MNKFYFLFTTFKRNNIWFSKTKCSFLFLIKQLKIVYFDLNLFEIFEIFLDAVFLLTIPDLATCIRID